MTRRKVRSRKDFGYLSIATIVRLKFNRMLDRGILVHHILNRLTGMDIVPWSLPPALQFPAENVR